MNKRTVITIIAVFCLGIAVGAFARGKSMDTSIYHGKSKQEAAKALLDLARTQAGKGSWENIGVGRVYYLGGMKKEGQAIFDTVTAKKKDAGDYIRIGRVYYDAGDWDKAKAAFDQALTMEPKDAPWLAEVGAYYNLKGDRAKAEEMFDRSYAAESGEVWATANIAGSYLGIQPLR
ncbi:MAG: tetratricopeptide repeat protein [Acidobacteria bacterium]|nr:tetratricopeptide repeat protein [Acidobacteriota bacterium]